MTMTMPSTRPPRKPLRALVAGCALALATSLATPDAAAFCRTTTSTTAVCAESGKPLSWASRCVGYTLQSDASTQIDLASMRALMKQAFAAWSTASCPTDLATCGGSGGGAPSIEAHDLGDVSCACAEYNQGKPGNANVISFRDVAWTDCDGTPKPAGTLDTIALTTVTYNVETGEIFDADMEINSALNHFTTTDPPAPAVTDLLSVMTHEAGHFLGLAHSVGHGEATMFESYEPGSRSMRDLAADDVCGICTVYPPSRAASCDDAPRHGFASTCGFGSGPDAATSCGCAVPGRAGSAMGALAAGALALAVAVRRRRRAQG
jgi:MYXO-CTERM domain-containing protein